MRAAHLVALIICLVGCEGTVTESTSPSRTLLARGDFLTGVGEEVALEATREGPSVIGRMTVSAQGQTEPYAFSVDLQCGWTTDDGMVMIGGVTTDRTGRESPQLGSWAGIVLERGSPVGASTWRSVGRGGGGSCLAFLHEQDIRERTTHPGPDGDWTDPVEGAVQLGP